MTGITLYSCGPNETALARAAAPTLGIRPTITARPVSAATIGLAEGNRCISVGHQTAISNFLLKELRHLGVRYLSTRSIGCNHLDREYAEKIGLEVGTVAYSPDSVADYTVMLMLMSLRSMKSAVFRVDARDYRLGEAPGQELRDLTVGVIGTGRIGTAVIDRLRGFGSRILACDPNPTADAEYVPLDDLLRGSDLVTLHAPLAAETRHLLDRQRIERLKPAAFVVNTGRGGLLDTEALLDALESGRLGGAALDVVEGEEGAFYADCRDRPDENPVLARLRKLPNVLLTPHTAYYTGHALRDAVENSLRNCLEFERGISA